MRNSAVPWPVVSRGPLSSSSCSNTKRHQRGEEDDNPRLTTGQRTAEFLMLDKAGAVLKSDIGIGKWEILCVSHTHRQERHEQILGSHEDGMLLQPFNYAALDIAK